MRKTLTVLAVALILPASFALADSPSVIAPAQQQALQPSQLPQASEAQSLNAYRANINPGFAVPTTGVYDQGDSVTNLHGFPLEGWSQIKMPPT